MPSQTKRVFVQGANRARPQDDARESPTVHAMRRAPEPDVAKPAYRPSNLESFLRLEGVGMPVSEAVPELVNVGIPEDALRAAIKQRLATVKR